MRSTSCRVPSTPRAAAVPSRTTRLAGRQASATARHAPTQMFADHRGQSKLMRSFSTTSGRLWTWVWIAPMYSPSTPMKKSCTAPKK